MGEMGMGLQESNESWRMWWLWVHIVSMECRMGDYGFEQTYWQLYPRERYSRAREEHRNGRSIYKFRISKFEIRLLRGLQSDWPSTIDACHRAAGTDAGSRERGFRGRRSYSIKKSNWLASLSLQRHVPSISHDCTSWRTTTRSFLIPAVAPGAVPVG